MSNDHLVVLGLAAGTVLMVLAFKSIVILIGLGFLAYCGLQQIYERKQEIIITPQFER